MGRVLPEDKSDIGGTNTRHLAIRNYDRMELHGHRHEGRSLSHWPLAAIAANARYLPVADDPSKSESAMLWLQPWCSEHKHMFKFGLIDLELTEFHYICLQ